MKLKGRWTGVALVLSTALVSGVSIYVNRFTVATVPPNVFTGAKNLLVAHVPAKLAAANLEALDIGYGIAIQDEYSIQFA